MVVLISPEASTVEFNGRRCSVISVDTVDAVGVINSQMANV